MKKLLLLTSIVFILSSCGPQGNYPNLTSCMRKNGVVMFGASWCPHCANQKNLFEKSKNDMPYFECSTGNNQAQECIDRAIMSYPTWQFPDATIKSLPEEALASLWNRELTTVRSTIEAYKEAVKQNNPELSLALENFSKKTELLAVSPVSEYEKLTKLTVPSEGPDGKFVEYPAYLVGRITGELTLPEIALYSGCGTEYTTDISTKKQ